MEVLIIPIVIIGAILYVISLPGYKYMLRRNVKGARWWSLLIAATCFCAISFGIISFLAANFHR